MLEIVKTKGKSLNDYIDIIGKEEIESIKKLALPLKGKKNNLTKSDFLKYFAIEKLGLNQNVIDGIVQEFHQVIPEWRELIYFSFLSQQMQEKYLQLLDARCERLNIL